MKCAQPYNKAANYDENESTQLYLSVDETYKHNIEKPNKSRRITSLYSSD